MTALWTATAKVLRNPTQTLKMSKAGYQHVYAGSNGLQAFNVSLNID